MTFLVRVNKIIVFYLGLVKRFRWCCDQGLLHVCVPPSLFVVVTAVGYTCPAAKTSLSTSVTDTLETETSS